MCELLHRNKRGYWYMLQKKKSKSNDNDNEILKIHQGVPEIHTYIFPMILYCKNNYRTYMIEETKKKKRGSSSK